VLNNILGQFIIPNGPVSFRYASLLPGERVYVTLRLLALDCETGYADCALQLQYQMASIDHCQPWEFSFIVVS
jgi:hypothetical protein